MASSVSSLFVQPLAWGGFSAQKGGASSRKVCPTFSACSSITVAAAGRTRKKELWAHLSRPSFRDYARSRTGRPELGLKTTDSVSCRRRARGRKGTTTAAFDGYDQGTEIDILGESIAEDFYSVLGVVSFLIPAISGIETLRDFSSVLTM